MIRPKLVAAAIVLLIAAVVARMRLEPEAAAVGKVRNPAWIPDGNVLRITSFGHRLAVADLYWLRTVQYIGETVMTDSNRWEALYPLANVVTDLDPRYGYAYQVAGSNLGGLAHRYAEADKILLKGMRNLPDRWTLPFTLAVNKFFYEGDFAAGAEYARIAARAGKRPHLALLAANLSLASDRTDEYATAEAFLEETLRLGDALRLEDTPELHAQLAQRLVKVRTYAVLHQVERAVAAYRAAEGRNPVFLGELITKGYLSAIPADPSGGTLLYDPRDGAVTSSVLGERKPLRVTRARTAQ
jgi:tetratricopeptide (TPR) repeat protein